MTAAARSRASSKVRFLIRRPTAAASRWATASACSCVGASTITRTSDSVPEGRSSTRPLPSSASSSAATAACTSGAVARERSAGTLMSTCGSSWTAAASSATERPERDHARHDLQCRQQAVAGGRVVEHHDVAALLAAELVVAGQHRLEDVAVADGGLQHRDPGGRHGLVQPEVAHHRGHQHVAAGQPRVLARQGQQAEDLVAVEHRSRPRRRRCSGRRRRRARSRCRRRARTTAAASDSGCVAPAALVDATAVAVAVDRHDLGAAAPVELRGESPGGALGAVDDDLQPVERSGRGLQRLEVVLDQLGRSPRARLRPSSPVTPADVGQAGLDGVLLLVGRACGRRRRTASARCRASGCARRR